MKTGLHDEETHGPRTSSRRQAADGRTSTLSPSPQRSKEHELTMLQHSAGNRAVAEQFQSGARLPVTGPSPMARIDRQPTQGKPKKPDEDKVKDLDQLLDEILSKSQPPEVPAFEVITATTQSEYSRGEFEDRIQHLWRRKRMRFTEAARTTARTNRVGSGPRPTQSASVQPGGGVGYTKRWALALIAADYKTYGDLPAVARLLRKGSPYLASLGAEAERVITRRDPTAADMHQAIFDAIIDLSQSVEHGQLAELVVTFSGHGGEGDLTGVDEKDLKPADIQGLAEIGKDFGVHLVVIVDTCRAGPLIQSAQAQALDDIQEGTTELPATERSALTGRIKLAGKLRAATVDLGQAAVDYGDAIHDVRRQVGDGAYPDYFTHLQAVLHGIQGLRDLTLARRLEPSGATMDLSPLADPLHQAQLAAVFAFAGKKRDAKVLLRQLANLLDTANDTLNAEIVGLDAAVKQAAAPQTTPAGQP